MKAEIVTISASDALNKVKQALRNIPIEKSGKVETSIIRVRNTASKHSSARILVDNPALRGTYQGIGENRVIDITLDIFNPESGNMILHKSGSNYGNKSVTSIADIFSKERLDISLKEALISHGFKQ